MSRYDEVLAQQLAMNPHTFQALQRAGLTPDSKVSLDFLYKTRDQAAADALMAFLRAETDYDVRVEKQSRMLRARFVVAGTTQPTTITLDILNDWIKWMVLAGAEHHCEFDGWGALV